MRLILLILFISCLTGCATTGTYQHDSINEVMGRDNREHRHHC